MKALSYIFALSRKEFHEDPSSSRVKRLNWTILVLQKQMQNNDISWNKILKAMTYVFVFSREEFHKDPSYSRGQRQKWTIIIRLE